MIRLSELQFIVIIVFMPVIMFLSAAFGLFCRVYTKEEIKRHEIFDQILIELKRMRSKGIDVRRLEARILRLIQEVI